MTVLLYENQWSELPRFFEICNMCESFCVQTVWSHQTKCGKPMNSKFYSIPPEELSECSEFDKGRRSLSYSESDNLTMTSGNIPSSMLISFLAFIPEIVKQFWTDACETEKVINCDVMEFGFDFPRFCRRFWRQQHQKICWPSCVQPQRAQV